MSRLAALFLAFAPVGALPALEIGDWLRLDGFATAGMIYGDDDQALVRTDPQHRFGSREELRFDADSKVGVQATLNPQGPWRVTAQLLARQDYQGSFSPQFEWAYGAWSITPEFELRLGRTVTPLFLMSDYRYLGYAQLMVRPPPEVYNINTISHLDGVSLLWNPSPQWQVEAYAGQTRLKLASGSADIDLMAGASVRWSDGPWLLRASLAGNRFSFNSASARDASVALAALPPAVCLNCQTEAAKVVFEDVHSQFYSLGMNYDDGRLLFQSEWAYRSADYSLTIGEPQAWYALLGYRWGDFTPYAGYSRTRSGGDTVNFVAGPVAPPALQSQLDYLNQSNFGRGNGDHQTYTLGLRWDVASNAAIKFQFDHLQYDQPEIGSSGGFLTYPTSLLGGKGFDGAINVYTLNLDLVF